MRYRICACEALSEATGIGGLNRHWYPYMAGLYQRFTLMVIELLRDVPNFSDTKHIRRACSITKLGQL